MSRRAPRRNNPVGCSRRCSACDARSSCTVRVLDDDERARMAAQSLRRHVGTDRTPQTPSSDATTITPPSDARDDVPHATRARHAPCACATTTSAQSLRRHVGTVPFAPNGAVGCLRYPKHARCRDGIRAFLMQHRRQQARLYSKRVRGKLLIIREKVPYITSYEGLA